MWKCAGTTEAGLELHTSSALLQGPQQPSTLPPTQSPETTAPPRPPHTHPYHNHPKHCPPSLPHFTSHPHHTLPSRPHSAQAGRASYFHIRTSYFHIRPSSFHISPSYFHISSYLEAQLVDLWFPLPAQAQKSVTLQTFSSFFNEKA